MSKKFLERVKLAVVILIVPLIIIGCFVTVCPTYFSVFVAAFFILSAAYLIIEYLLVDIEKK